MQNAGSVLIVDDHPMIRFAVKTLFEQNGWKVVAEAGSGVDALSAARQHQPDLIVLDIGIPKMDGLMVISRLRGGDENRGPRIVVLSAQNPEHLAARCLHAGAVGFVYKGKELTELIGAAKAVMQGNTYFPSVALRPTPDGSGGEDALIRLLSDRELVVLQHLARGALNKTIAATLMLSEKTVSTYKTRLLEKLNVTSLLELTDMARRNGLV
ncbi:response regulator transcription factor [Achromobacter aloeverae]|uniref:response regulator transcription factor n=1 Tax=Achromobacter aloeverae TaxID=1750518 RepID=UPI001F023F30|nr:response regulator transcription factor [Achromobacter aloeverae]